MPDTDNDTDLGAEIDATIASASASDTDLGAEIDATIASASGSASDTESDTVPVSTASVSPAPLLPRRSRRSGVAALCRGAVRAASRARESARAQRRTVVVVVGTAVVAFLAAWWLSPVAAGSAGSLTTIGMAAATTSPTAAPSASKTVSSPGAASASGSGSTAGGSSEQVTTGTGDGAAEGTASGSKRSLFVHVSGAVAKPGLVEVSDGARVFDAVAQAGGVTPEAREGGVNLARFVVDGEQILVPRADDPSTAGASATGSASAGSLASSSGSGNVGSTSGAGASGSPAKVNLNTATAAELETLPRVGPSMSAKILAWRAENGAFSAIDDLNDVDGVGDKTFESLKDLVTL